MAQTVFNRYEKKYLLDSVQRERLLEAIDPFMKEDEYGLSTICNIYYDTQDSLLIRRSIEKPDYKEKLRLRSYGIPRRDSTVFLEIKKKCLGNVNKRRVQLSLKEAYDYLEKGIRPDRDSQILREIDFLLQRYELNRSLYLAYDRTAYRMRDGGTFRMTIDSNIRSRRHDIALETGDEGEALLEEGRYLLESKIAGASPLWFAQILSSLEIRPVSFSKYGNAFKRQLLSEYPHQPALYHAQALRQGGIVVC